MAPFSHLSLSERVEIQSRLSGSQTLNAIARYLHRDRQTIAREPSYTGWPFSEQALPKL